MSINALLLNGWDEASTWGDDNGVLYAQLTPNGVADDDGPQVWITPSDYELVDAHDLACAIAETTRTSVDQVVWAMRRGRGTDHRRSSDL